MGRTYQAIKYKNARDFGHDVLSLPFDDIPTALSLALDKIKTYNRTEMPVSTRVLATSPFNVAVGRISDYYRNFIYSDFFKLNGFLPPFDQADIGKLIELQKEMGYAYKHILMSLIDGPESPLEIAQNAYMVLFYHDRQLLIQYAFFRNAAQHNWQEINDIYRYCEAHSCLNVDQYNPIDTEQCQSVRTLFIKIQLLSLSDPFSLSLGEVWNVSDYLAQWADTIEIQPSRALGNTHCFCLNLNENYHAFIFGAVPFHNTVILRWISIKKIQELIDRHILHLKQLSSPLEIGIRNHLDNHQETDPHNKKSISLLSKLSQAWRPNSNRKKDRIEKTEIVDIVWGLAPIHSTLSPAHTSPNVVNSIQDKNRSKKAYVQANTENKSIDGICVQIYSDLTQASNDAVRDSNNTLVSNNTVPISINTAPVLNNLDSHLTTGQIVAIIGNKREDLKLGIVCWIFKNGDSDSRLGIKIICDNASPVMIKSHLEELADSPALLVTTQDHSGNQISSLIGPLHLATKNDNYNQNERYVHRKLPISVKHPKITERHNIELTKTLISSPLFEHLEFKHLVRKPKSRKALFGATDT